MTQYIITLQDEAKGNSLITFLNSLDFVTIQPKAFMQKDTHKASKRKPENLSSFLQSLPEVDYNESDVIEVLKLMRDEEKTK